MGFIEGLMSAFGYAPITLPPIGLRGDIIPAYRTSVSAAIKAESLPEDEPKFKRRYTTEIAGGFRLEVEMKTYTHGSRYCSGYLWQSNGKMIGFDPHAVADKIIDRDLAPLVQQLSDQIIALDKDFCRSGTGQYTDDTGVMWIRADRLLPPGQ